MSKYVIVSRHKGAVEFICKKAGVFFASEIAEEMDDYLEGFSCWMTSGNDSVTVGYDGHKDHGPMCGPRVLSSATADDVKGKIVYGNLPMHLAVHAAEVRVVEFSGDAPRGAEYTIEDMVAAGAHISCYRVSNI